MAINATTVGSVYQVGSVDYNSIYSGIIRVKVNSTSAEDNTSNITVSWIYRKNASDPYGAYNNGTSSSVTLNVNGYSSTKTSATFDLRDDATGTELVLHSMTTDISHESDGSKSIAIFGSHTTGVSWGTVSISSVTVNLPTIARASSISSVTSSVSMTGSGVCTVTINRASTSFTHTVVFKSPSYTYSQTYTGVGTSQSYTIPTTWMNSVTSATSGTATVIVTTFNGTTQIGSSVTANFTVTVPNSVVPSIGELTISRNALNDSSGWGLYLKGYTGALVTAGTASGVYGSSISSITISGGGYSVSSSSTFEGLVLTTGVLGTAGTNVFTATITDSRGKTATTTASITVTDYALPSISSMANFRCTSSGVSSSSGTYISATATGVINSNGTKSMRVFYKKSTASTYTYVSITSGVAEIIGSGQISVDSSYDVYYYLTDGFKSVTSAVSTVASSISVIDVKANGKGIAFGGSAETDSTVEIQNWNLTVDGNITVGGTFIDEKGTAGDCDTIFDVGKYSIDGTTTNAPFSYGMMRVDKRFGTTGATFQTAYSSYGSVHYRLYWSSSWTDWKQFTLT